MLFPFGTGNTKHCGNGFFVSLFYLCTFFKFYYYLANRTMVLNRKMKMYDTLEMSNNLLPRSFMI